MSYNFDNETQMAYDVQVNVMELKKKISKLEDDAFRYEDSFAILIALLEKTELSDDANSDLKDLREHFYPTKKEKNNE